MTGTLFALEEVGVATHCAEVAIPLPVGGPFTYRVPEKYHGRHLLGCRVHIPFRNRTITGFVVGAEEKVITRKIKDILEVLDEEAVLDDHAMRLARWISEYYFSSWGEALSNSLPKFRKRKGERKERHPDDNIDYEKKKITLNKEQQEAFNVITEKLASGRFSEIFLHGVTGSGKSELYIRSIKHVLKSGKSAICLVPEIALTEQLTRFFWHHFKGELEILHSKLTDRERLDAWQAIKRGEKRVILGPRSAVFAPTSDLGLIIMDEEQEGSYKQDQVPRYHAREVARWRAADLNALFLMGTATPTLETMHRVKTGEIALLTLKNRVDGRKMPDVMIVDLKEEQNRQKRPVIVSHVLKRAMTQALENKEGILLLLNRRGFSTHIRCTQCSELLRCPSCDVSLTYHQDTRNAICHYCNFQKEVPPTCESCKHPLLQFNGVGTEKVESEIARLFPTARIARLDADVTKKRGAHKQILKSFREEKLDILVGTQMIAKGFDFQHVTLVGIVNADTGFLLPDFRSSERTFQLLTQMAGRTGRGHKSGHVIIQTYSPSHYSITFAAKHEYHGFFEVEMKRRAELSYPPYMRLINVMFRGKHEQEVYQQANQFAAALRSGASNKPIEVIGPAPLPFHRLRGQYRWHVMVRAKVGYPIQSAIKAGLDTYRPKKNVHLAVDTDPVAIL